jgi:tripartite-type tricarboxylate transporter receptor subunit TctC
MRRLLTFLLLLLPGLALAGEKAPRILPGQGPIRMIVPFVPGSGADAAARILAPPLATALGRPIQVEHRPGGRGTPGAEAVARAMPDGQTLGLFTAASHGTAPPAEYPPQDSHGASPIALIAGTPTVLLVPADSRFQAMESYLRAGRSWMRGLSFGSPAVGSLPHRQGEMLAKAAGARLLHVVYRGTASALPDLLNGQVESLLAPLASVMPAVRGGQVRALAVSSPAEEPMLPGVPSFAVLGYPQLTATTWIGLSGPPGLPPALVARLEAEVSRVVALPEVAQRLRMAGLTQPVRPLAPTEDQRLVADSATIRQPDPAAGMRVN